MLQDFYKNCVYLRVKKKKYIFDMVWIETLNITEVYYFLFLFLLDKREPLMAGVWASMGSTLGKLSGSQIVVGDSYFLWALLLIMMIIVNTWGCRCYLRALDKSTEAVTPTVISSATSFLFSAVIEVVVFNGKTSLKWWLGTIFILQGIALVARNPKLPLDNNNEESFFDSHDDDFLDNNDEHFLDTN